MAKPSSIYQLKVTLKGVRPPIWRRVQVPGDVTFYALHRILQEVMGWYGYHLYLFEVNGLEVTDSETAREFGGKDAQRVKLNQLIKNEKVKFRYEYDFGDSWEHEILVERILAREEGVHYPICLAGKRACPPEDVGGVWGYADFLEAIQDPDHPEHEDLLEWFGGEFDPEEFDLEDVNDALGQIE